MSKDIYKIIEENVSRETFLRLQEFVELLLKWNKKINLISKKTKVEEIWLAHILDSIALSNYIIQKNKLLIDIGSGAGFPGLILSIINYQYVILVETNTKKAAFLNFVISKLKLNCQVENRDIGKLTDYTPFYVTSRAMAPISMIIKMTQNIMRPETEYIFHIGEADIKSEIELLEQSKSFELQEWRNPYKYKCRIISIKNIKRRDI